MQIKIPEAYAPLLLKIGNLAEETGDSAYLVGGPVRDLILGKAIKDIDIMLKKDGIKIAKLFGRMECLNVETFADFYTAKVFYDGLEIDFSTAREESYPSPGSLPIVRRGSVEQDIKRRDYTINAMAIHINPGKFGKLYDPLNGKKDLKNGLLRVIHRNSFQDDPTRIIRGIRFSARFGFRFEKDTHELIERDLKYLDYVSWDRIIREIRLICGEGEKGILLLEEFGVSNFLGLCHIKQKELKDISNFCKNYNMKCEIPLFMSLLLCKDLKGLNLEREILRELEEIKSLKRGGFNIHRVLHLRDYSFPVLFSVCKNKGYVEKAFKNRALFSPKISGKELLQLGIKEGPEMGKILDEIIELRWKGRIKTKEDEIKYIKERRRNGNK